MMLNNMEGIYNGVQLFADLYRCLDEFADSSEKQLRRCENQTNTFPGHCAEGATRSSNRRERSSEALRPVSAKLRKRLLLLVNKAQDCALRLEAHAVLGEQINARLVPVSLDRVLPQRGNRVRRHWPWRRYREKDRREG